MRKQLLIAVWCFLAMGANALAQQTVSGSITASDTGEPLEGVAVVVKGTTIGAFSDADGKYTLALPSDANVITFSLIGYQVLEQTVDGRSTLDVVMQQQDLGLGEVVITGYGSQIKRELTGNIAKVSAEEIENQPVTSFEQALQGRAAGVFVSTQNGKLGQGVNIRIRGSASVTASNEPLYVVDGIVVTSQSQSSLNASTNPLADLNFNDIESIEILKDASAASIYGSRASNGVVIITTKKGKAGKTQFNVNVSAGMSEPSRLREWLNGPEYLQLWDEAFNNVADPDGTLFGLSAEEWKDRRIPGWRDGNDTDWQEEAFRDNAGIQQIDLSARGGNDKTQFYVSGSMMDQKGIMIYNDFVRHSGRINLDHQASANIKVGMNLSLARTINDRLPNDNQFSTPLQLIALPPVQPLNDPDNPDELFQRTVYFNGKLYENNTFFEQRVFRSLGNAFLEWNLLEGLTFHTDFGVDVLSQMEEQYFGTQVSRNTGEPNGFGRNTFTHTLNYSTNNFFTYNNTFGSSTLNLVGGMSFQESRTDFGNVEGRNFPNDDFKKLASAAEISGGTSTSTLYNIVSYFARANYKLNEKYLVSLAARIDGDSRFGADERYGFFPSASLGWILSEESFLQGQNILSFLKFRASYGITGNTPTTNFPSRGLWGGAAGYAGASGISPTQSPNPNLKWENTAQTDIGIDFGFFNDRITGEIDYYIKNTTDLLLNVNVPATTGFLSQLRNVGELENRGFEFVLNSRNLQGVVTWNTSINFAANRNEIKDLDGQIIEGGFINRAVEGEPIGVFFAPEYAGVDPENGDAIYYLNTELPGGGRDRGTTSNYNEAQRVVIGDPNPDFIYGINNTFTFAGFDLAVFLQGVHGNDIYNGGGVFQMDGFGWFDNQDRRVLNRWQQAGDQTDIPQLRFLEGTNESSRFLEDGSYLRVKNITLGYTLPTDITRRLKLDRIRIYATGINVAVITDYQGWDPEVNADFTASNIGLGNDFYTAPQPRTYSLGVNVGF